MRHVVPRHFEFSGLFPLTLFWAFMTPHLQALPGVVRAAVAVAINVGLMVYLYLPTLTHVLRKWLSK